MIAVRDLAIQRREDDLVAVTFGRGFYILDDYSPLRGLDSAGPGDTARLFAPRRALLFNESMDLGYPDKGFQGDSFFNAPNPPNGALLTYQLPEGLQSRRELRRQAEKELEEAGESVSYPSWDELRAEDREEDPMIVLTVRDASGKVVRRVTGPTEAGLHRVSWDLRYPPSEPSSLSPPGFVPFGSPPMGPAVAPGSYTVSLAQRLDGEDTELAGPVDLEVAALGLGSLEVADRQAMLDFQQQTARLRRAVQGALRSAGEAQERVDHLRVAARDTPAADDGWMQRLDALDDALDDLLIELRGDRTVSSRSEPTPPSISRRVGRAMGQWTSSSAPTATHRRNVAIASAAFGDVLSGLRELFADMRQLESEMEAAGAPWTPGRLPDWRPE